MDEPRVVKVMWDYDAFPLWVSGGRVGQVSSRSVPVSDALAADLQAWSDEMTSLMWGPNGPDDPKWAGPDPAELAALNAAGQALARRVRAELTSEWNVTYFDEVTGEVAEVVAAPRKRWKPGLGRSGHVHFD